MANDYRNHEDDWSFKIEENVLKGREVPYRMDYNNLGKLILDKMESDENFVGLIDPVTGKKIAYKEMRERSVRCALWMKKNCLGAGDVVAICSHNQPDAMLTCFAALYIGAIFNPLDAAGMITKDFRHLLAIMKPKMAFADEKSAPVIAEAAEEANVEVKIVVFGKVAGFLEYENVINEPKIEQVKSFRMEEIETPDKTAFIMCSSGTTGLPKGVALNHGGLLKSLSSFDSMLKSDNHTAMVFSSLYWMSGTFFAFISLLVKMRYLIAPPFEEHTACSYIEKYKVNWLLIAPSSICRWIKSEALTSGRYDLTSLKIIMYGGSPIPAACIDEFAKYVPNAKIVSLYGMTEVGGAVTQPGPTVNAGSCGRIASNVQLKVIDPETGRLLGVNETGELLVKTSTMMNGYYNNPEATAAALDKEGWLSTGDLGYYNEHGEIFVVDRIKELIKFCNYQISPNEIETVIMSHPGVEEAVVVGLPHPEDGEHPIAFVVRSTASPYSDPAAEQVTESDLIDLVEAELSDIKRLRGGVRFMDSLPRSSSDKILRKIVRDIAKNTR